MKQFTCLLALSLTTVCVPRTFQQMSTNIGEIEAIFRYPVKSMRGEPLENAALGWHGLDGDRRFAFRRLDDRSGFPWLTASKVPELILFTPQGNQDKDGEALPTHVLTPAGERMPLFGDALVAEIGRRYAGPVQMTHLKNGIFDDASVSLITSGTVDEVCRLAGQNADARRFRPNILVRSKRGVPFEEDAWLGCTLTFGESGDEPAIALTTHDVRCAMVNIDCDDGSIAPEVLKASVRANQNNAGLYGAVTRIGRIAVGQSVILHSGPGLL